MKREPGLLDPGSLLYAQARKKNRLLIQPLIRQAYCTANREHKGETQGHPSANRPSLRTSFPGPKGYNTISNSTSTTIPTQRRTTLVARVRRQPSAQASFAHWPSRHRLPLLQP
jgi:hypothetical protein